MGCGDEKLSKYLTQVFMVHCNAMICQQVTLSGDVEWLKVADTVIETLHTGLYNSGTQPLPEVGARHEWTLEAVGSIPLFK